MMAEMKAASKDDDGYDGDVDGPGSQDTLILGNSPDDRVNLWELSQLSGINLLMGESGWFEEQNPEVVGFSLPPRHGLEGIPAGITAKEWIGSEGVEALSSRRNPSLEQHGIIKPKHVTQAGSLCPRCSTVRGHYNKRIVKAAIRKCRRATPADGYALKARELAVELEKAEQCVCIKELSDLMGTDKSQWKKQWSKEQQIQAATDADAFIA